MSLVFLFLTGFLISRLSVKYHLVEIFFARLFRARSDSLRKFFFYLLAATALVSMFTPNFIAALTLLPMLETLRHNFEQHHPPKIARRLITAMVITVMYGCNIGGMGSLVGSPANALMLGALELFKVTGREKINFLSWFGWSLPLVIIMLLMAWAQVVYFFTPPHVRREAVRLPEFRFTRGESVLVRRAWQALALWFGFWALHSIVQILAPSSGWSISLFNFELGWNLWDQVAACFGAVYLGLLYLPLYRTPHQRRAPLLQFSDTFEQLPVRAFIFVAIILLISGAMISFGVPGWLGDRLVHVIPREAPPYLLYFLVCFITTMATEFLSNTAVVVVFFPLVHGLAVSLGLEPMVALMAISLASTNAFMLPLGTPVNALLYGGVKNVSLPLMAASGLVLNLISALWMSGFLEYVIPWYYDL